MTNGVVVQLIDMEKPIGQIWVKVQTAAVMAFPRRLVLTVVCTHFAIFFFFSYVLVWDKEIPPEDRIIRFRRNYSSPMVEFPCPTPIHNDGYFSRPLCDFFRIFGVCH